MTEAILMMLAVGGICGTVLSLASKIFYVYEDPRIAEVESNLAGANCGETAIGAILTSSTYHTYEAV